MWVGQISFFIFSRTQLLKLISVSKKSDFSGLLYPVYM